MRGALAIGIWVVALATPASALVCGDAILDLLGEACDQGLLNGTPGSCCTIGCQLEPATTICRAAVDACDVEEAPRADAMPDRRPRTRRRPDGFCDTIDVCPASSARPRPTSTTTRRRRATSARTNWSFADRAVTLAGSTPPGDGPRSALHPFSRRRRSGGERHPHRARQIQAVVADVTIPPGERGDPYRLGEPRVPGGHHVAVRNTGAVSRS
jgi:hypothetical protein